MDDIKFSIIEGIHALLHELHSPRPDQIGRVGGERSAFEDNIYKGRLRHFSVSAKKNLQKDIINAIINKDADLRQTKRRSSSYLILLKNRKKVRTK